MIAEQESLERTRAGHVGCRCGRIGPPASRHYENISEHFICDYIFISGFGCSSVRCGKATSASQDREQLRELNDLVVDLTRGQRRTDYADEREPRYRALQKFREMGQAASPAIPALTKLLHNERSALEAASALVSIGSGSVKPLMKGLDDKNAEVRFRSAYSLGELQTEARAAVPALYKLAQNPDEAEIVREHAIWALGRIEGKSAPNAK